jgi:hypothetical protein
MGLLVLLVLLVRLAGSRLPGAGIPNHGDAPSLLS